MRPLYTKFSLVFLFFLLLLSNSPIAMVSSVDKDLTTKDKIKETTNPTKPRNEVGGKNDRPKKDETFPSPTKKKAKVLQIPTTIINEDVKTPSFTPLTLSSKGLQPIKTNFNKETNYNKIVGPDPFRFTITSNKDSVAIGEEIELTIAVDWVDFGVNNGVRFLPEWYKYVLRVVTPKGFIQTGGDYTDFCTKPVDANNPQAVFTIKGKFENTPEEAKFTVLRGFEGADAKSEFIWKGEKMVFFQNIDITFRDLHFENKSSVKNGRIASSACNSERNVNVCVTNAYRCGSSITKVVGTISTTNLTNTDIYLYWHISGTGCIIANPGTNPGQKFTVNKNSPTTFTLTGNSTSTHLDIGIGGIAESNKAFGCYFDFSGAIEDIITTPVISSSNQLCSVKLSTSNVSVTATSSSSSRIAAGESYQWKKDGVDVGGNSSEYETTQTGSFTLTVTKDGCSLTSAPLVINSIPGLTTPTINPANQTCSVKLTASIANVDYVWKKDGVIKAGNSQDYYATETGIYTVTISKTGCTPASVTSAGTTVSAIPSLSTPTASYSGLLRTLEATGCASGATYKWSDGNTQNPRTLNSGDLRQYKAICEKSGCKSDSSNAVGETVSTTNEPTSISVPTLTYCASNVTLTANGCNATKKTRWYFQPIGSSYGAEQDKNGNTNTVATSFNGKVKVYCLDGTTLSTGYIERDVDATSIKSIPKPSGITFSSTMPLNPNESVTITIGGCIDNTDPAWSTDNVNFTKEPTGSFNKSFTVTGTLYAKCIYGVGCESETISTPVTVATSGCTSFPAGPSSASVSPSSYNDDAIPESVTLTANCGSNTVTWDKSGSPAPRVTTVFTARCQDANGCVSTGTATATVTVGTPPPVCGTPGSPTIEGYNTSICLDDNKTIFLYARNCEAGATVLWSDGYIGLDYQIAGNTVFSKNLTAKCRRTCPSGEFSYSSPSAGVDIEVKDCEVTLPVPFIQIYNSIFCAGTDQAYMYARGCAVGQTVVWSNGFTKYKNSDADDEYVTGTGGNYTAKCRDSRGRESNSSNSVTVEARTCPVGCTDPNVTAPNPPLVEGFNLAICPDSKRPIFLTARNCKQGETIVWSDGMTKVKTQPTGVQEDNETHNIFARELINLNRTYLTMTARCRNACGTSSASNSVTMQIKPADKPILKSNSSLTEFGILGGIETGEDLHVWVQPNAPALYKDYKWTFKTNPTVISTTDKVDIVSVRDVATGTYTVYLKTGANECVVSETIDVVIKPWECKLTVEANPICYIETNKRWANLELKVKNRTKNWRGYFKIQRIKDIEGEPVSDPIMINDTWTLETAKDKTYPLQVKIPDGIYRVQMGEKRSDEESGPGFECLPSDIYITVGCQRKCKKLQPCLTGDCCGIPANIDLDQTIKLETLAVNDVVKANDFEVIITKVTVANAANYSWNIEAISKVPVFDNVFIGLKSDNLKPVVFNECKELVSNDIITLYNPANWDKPIQGKAIAKALYESAKEILEAITTNPDVKVEMSKEDLANIAQQLREQAAKDLPKDLELRANEAVRKMEEARDSYQKAKTAGDSAGMAAATTKFNAAKAEFDAIKDETIKYLNLYQKIVQLTLNKMSTTYGTATALTAPTNVAIDDNQPVSDYVPIDKLTGLTPAEVTAIIDAFKIDARANLNYLFRYFIQTHSGNTNAIKDLEQRIKVYVKEDVGSTAFLPVSPAIKLSEYIYSTMCKTCTGTTPDPLESKMVNTTEKALIKRINELFGKLIYTQD